MTQFSTHNLASSQGSGTERHWRPLIYKPRINKGSGVRAGRIGGRRPCYLLDILIFILLLFFDVIYYRLISGISRAPGIWLEVRFPAAWLKRTPLNWFSGDECQPTPAASQPSQTFRIFRLGTSGVA